MVFTTHLVGVNKDGRAIDLGIGFTWASTYNGTSGGVATTKNAQGEDLGTGTGGITILTVQDTSVPLTVPSTRPLTSGDACNGSFSGQFAGDINVVAGQKCVFTEGTIIGSVHQVGGLLVLEGVLVTGDVEIHEAEELTIGPFSEIDGHLEIRDIKPGEKQNMICSTTIEGNAEFEHNIATLQVGSSHPVSCAGNVIGGNLHIHNNFASIVASANTINGDFDIGQNVGGISVFRNDITKVLRCKGNSMIAGATNLAAEKTDQCVSF